MFWKRFISGFVILLITLLLGMLGGPVLAFALCVISCIGFIEFTKASQVREKGHHFNALECIGLITICGYYVLLMITDPLWPFADAISEWLKSGAGMFNSFTIMALLIFSTGFICILGSYIFSFPKFHINQVAKAIFGMLYVGLMLSFIYCTRALPNGIYMVWMVFIPAWVCDTCAYFTGMLFGKHKLSPKLSPKKSIEGSIGGILGASIAGGLLGWLYVAMNDDLSIRNIFIFAAIAFVGSIVSQCGDLAASAVKRNYDVKDYGKLIPGHGGILDRFDSVLFTSPMVYFLMVLFVQIKG